MPGPCTATTQTADLGIGRLRWSLGELADAVSGLIAEDAQDSYSTPRWGPYRLRRAALAGAIAAVCVAAGGMTVVVAFLS